MKHVSMERLDEHIFDLKNDLFLINMKANFPEFVDAYGFEEADRRMERLYGQTFTDQRNHIHQWYDFEILGVKNEEPIDWL